MKMIQKFKQFRANRWVKKGLKKGWLQIPQTPMEHAAIAARSMGNAITALPLAVKAGAAAVLTYVAASALYEAYTLRELRKEFVGQRCLTPHGPAECIAFGETVSSNDEYLVETTAGVYPADAVRFHVEMPSEGLGEEPAEDAAAE